MRISQLALFLAYNVFASAEPFANPHDALDVHAHQHHAAHLLKRDTTVNPVTNSAATFTMPNLAPTSKVSITSQSSGTQRATTAFQKATTTVQSSAVQMQSATTSSGAANTGVVIGAAHVVGAVLMMWAPF